MSRLRRLHPGRLLDARLPSVLGSLGEAATAGRVRDVEEVWEYLCPQGCGGALVERGWPEGTTPSFKLPRSLPCPECGAARPCVLKSRLTLVVD